ncbi:UNVERIFIED_CONTAM: hypothetical protein RMT77_013304 [Armadillidium vulgare]
MEGFNCFTCGLFMKSSSTYHMHNVSVHTLEELSTTIIKILFKEGKIVQKKNLEANHVNHSGSNGYLQECMDEIIELGTMEGEDNLTVQSLLLKSNFTPNSRHVIEVQEKKQSKDVIKVLSQELNAAVVNFQNDFLSTGITGCFSKQFEHNQLNDSQFFSNAAFTTKRKAKRKGRTNCQSKSKQFFDNRTPEHSPIKRKDLSPQAMEKKSNVKIVLRSGRTIKTTPKYEDFIYYDDYKENLSSNRLMSSKSELNMDSASQRPITNTDHDILDVQCTKLLDLLPEFTLDDLNFSNELDIKIQDLDLSGFDDLDGTLPENQILTIDNLLQELEGGGSIEISNIIKENNIDSDTIVLDALSNPSGNPGDSNLKNDASSSELQDTLNSLKSKTKIRNTKSFCNICNKSYISKSNYKNHMEKYHITANKNTYKCSTCGHVFPFLATLVKHYKEHHPNQMFLCEICGRKFRNLINLKIHSALHNKRVTYQCHLCPNKYFLRYSYLSHIKSHENSTKFYCEKCDKQFSQKHHFNKHLTQHKEGKYLGRSKDLKCSFCNDIFIPTSQSDANMNFETCLKCKKGIYKKYLLVNKEYQEPNSEQKLLPREECKICGKRVKELQKHVRKTHLSNPNVECDLCGKTVKKAALNAHKLRLHTGIEAKCDHCHKVFKNALSLREHLNRIKKMSLV